MTMAEETTSYIAWDGKRYPGVPPMGWFLGADNRWWPNKDLLGTQREADPSQTPATTEAMPGATTSPAAASPRATASRTVAAATRWLAPPPPPSQRSSPAPMPATRPTAPPGPAQRRRPVPQTRAHPKARILVGVVCAWTVLMIGIDLLDSVTQSDSPIAPSDQVTTTAVQAELPIELDAPPTSALPASEVGTEDRSAETLPIENAPAEAVFVDNGVELAVTGCGPAVVTGLLSASTDIDAETLQITVVVLPENDPDGNPAFISRSVTTPTPRSTDQLVLTLPADIADVGCQVTAFTVNQ